MFELPRYVIQGGQMVVEQGEIRQDLYGRSLEGIVPDIKKWFESYYTIQFANYPVDARYVSHGDVVVNCQSRP